jgi:predicted dehydrogenase
VTAAEAPITAPAGRVRIAVIGTGWWATATHIPALIDSPHVDLAGLCDVSEARVGAAAAAFGVKRTYTDYRTLLATEQPDAVVVATTHASHFAVSRDCLEAGAHVLIEKPMTLRAAEARSLVELAARAGRSIVLGYPANHMAQARRARELITDGRIGPVQCVQSVFNSYNADLLAGRDRSETPGAYPVHGPGDVYSRKEHSGGGHGHLQITHAAGLLFFVTGLRAHSVTARMAAHGLPVDLVDVMLVEFEGGALGTISGTSNGFLPRSSLFVGCAAGSVEIEAFAETGTIRLAGGEREVLPGDEGADLRTAPIRSLIAIARGAEQPASPPEVGWRPVELLDAAYRSAEAQGRPVLVEELYRADG